MKLVFLTSEEFDLFSYHHIQGNFHQTSAWANLKKNNGWQNLYVGVKDDNDLLVAAGLILEKKIFLNKKIMYAPRGFLLDYNNYELLTFFISQIKVLAKKRNVVFLKLDPNVYYQELDIDGNKVAEGFDNKNIVDNLIKAGFLHSGFNKYFETIQPRYAFVLSLKDKTLDEIFDNFETKTRQMIRRNSRLGLRIRKLKQNEIGIFKDIMEKTATRRGFVDRSAKYYEQMVSSFKENAKIIICEVDLDACIRNLENDLLENKKLISIKEKSLTDEKAKINHQKTTNKINELKKANIRLEEKVVEYKDMRDKNGEVIVLGGIIYLCHNKEILSLFGGNYDEFMDFMPAYTINYEMIKYAYEQGYETYNFYGIIGDFTDKKNPLYGLYDFKRGFAGNVVEYIGEFTLIIRALDYKLYNVAFALYKKIKGLKK